MPRSVHPPRTSVPEGSLPIAFGEVLDGKYRVDQLLGQGGMAVVLAGTHVELDAPIAIKVLLPGRAGNPDAVRRFLTEARAAAKLKSANVARISDVGTAKTRAGPILPFIVMERLDGVDLATLMEHRQKLPVDEAVDFVRQACLGLAEAHAQGIIHRDIKPANLFLTRTREGAPIIKVLDFGISKTLASVETREKRAITADQEVMGSPGYMSPEQVKASKDVDPRTDIWSLGVVLHELLSGKETFAGDELHEIFASILHGEPAPLDDDVPDEVRAIVKRCLQKDPNRRYPSSAELADALARALDRPEGVPRPRAIGARGPLVAALTAAIVVIGGVALFARSRAEPDVSTAPAALSLESAIALTGAPARESPEPPSAASVEAPPPPSAEPEALELPAAKARPSAKPSASTSLPKAPVREPPWSNHKRTTW